MAFLLVFGLKRFSLNELILKRGLSPRRIYTHKNWQIMATVTSHSISEGVLIMYNMLLLGLSKWSLHKGNA